MCRYRQSVISKLHIFSKEMSSKFSKVFTISGNHEYYQPSYKDEKQDIDKTDQLINQLCGSLSE